MTHFQYICYSGEEIISSTKINPHFLTPVTKQNSPDILYRQGLPGGLSSKESACNAGDAGDTGLIPESGRFPGGGHGNSLQYSCLENPMDRGDWRVTVHRVAESDTTEVTEHARTHTIYAPGILRFSQLHKAVFSSYDF